jgi:hypothetical protein
MLYSKITVDLFSLINYNKYIDKHKRQPVHKICIQKEVILADE